MSTFQTENYELLLMLMAAKKCEKIMSASSMTPESEFMPPSKNNEEQRAKCMVTLPTPQQICSQRIFDLKKC
jgi:hypothetical protein